METFETFAEGLDHPEGAAFGPDGNVYVGGEVGQIYRISPDGAIAISPPRERNYKEPTKPCRRNSHFRRTKPPTSPPASIR